MQKNRLYYSRKINNKIFQKIQKILFWGHFGLFFAQIWPKMNFPKKKRFYKFLIITIIYHRAEIQKKTNESFLRKKPKWRMDGQTDISTEIYSKATIRSNQITCPWSKSLVSKKIKDRRIYWSLGNPMIK